MGRDQNRHFPKAEIQMANNEKMLHITNHQGNAT